MNVDKFNIILLSIVMFVLLISIIFAIRFQTKQKNKYKECLKLIKENEKGILDINNSSANIDLKNMNDKIDINKLMMELYDVYLEFIEKLNKNDNNFNGILDDVIKEFYENKVNIYQKKNHFEITDNIELVNYSILEYSESKIKFRVNLTNFNYKLFKQRVISGSNLERVNQIFLITYNRVKRKWLITNIEKVYEKKLSI